MTTPKRSKKNPSGLVRPPLVRKKNNIANTVPGSAETFPGNESHQQTTKWWKTSENKKNHIFKMFGNAILMASIQASIGSVEMSSKYSVINFSRDQNTLQAAADALSGYMIIAAVWMAGTCLLAFGQYGVWGLLINLIANGIMIAWIYFSYLHCFRTAAKKYHLKMPSLFFRPSIV